MKERTLNEYRQTKEYQGSSEGWKYLNDLENTKKEKLKKLEQAHKIPEEIQKIQEELEYKDVEFTLDDRDEKSKILFDRETMNRFNVMVNPNRKYIITTKYSLDDKKGEK